MKAAHQDILKSANYGNHYFTGFHVFCRCANVRSEQTELTGELVLLNHQLNPADVISLSLKHLSSP